MQCYDLTSVNNTYISCPLAMVKLLSQVCRQVSRDPRVNPPVAAEAHRHVLVGIYRRRRHTNTRRRRAQISGLAHGGDMDSHHDAVVTVLDAEIHTQNISKGDTCTGHTLTKNTVYDICGMRLCT